MVPTGWTAVDDDKTYLPLEDRVPKGKRPPGNDSEEFEMESPRANSESSNENDSSPSDVKSNQTRMNEESSEEDELVRPQPTRVSLTCLILSSHEFFGPFVVPFLYAF
jgi:hypothetical protein